MYASSSIALLSLLQWQAPYPLTLTSQQVLVRSCQVPHIPVSLSGQTCSVHLAPSNSRAAFVTSCLTFPFQSFPTSTLIQYFISVTSTILQFPPLSQIGIFPQSSILLSHVSVTYFPPPAPLLHASYPCPQPLSCHAATTAPPQRVTEVGLRLETRTCQDRYGCPPKITENPSFLPAP